MNTEIELVQTPYGPFWLPKVTDGDAIVEPMRRGEIYEPETINVCLEYAKRGMCVLDLGCCFGQYSIMLAGIVGGMGLVLAVEAEPFIAQCFTRTLWDRQAERLPIRLFNVAIWDQDHVEVPFPEPNFFIYKSWGSFGVDPNAAQARTLITATVDELVKFKPGGMTVSLIKLDVQGSEMRALKGAQRTIFEYRPAIVMEMDGEWWNRHGMKWVDLWYWIDVNRYRLEQSWFDGSNFVLLPK
jgi:FkbM family methyltransferase